MTANHHPKRGHKRRGKQRRKHPPSSRSLTAGNSLQSSSSPGSSSPEPSASTLESPPPPTRVDNLIDMDAPQSTPGQSMEEIMSTLNIEIMTLFLIAVANNYSLWTT